MVDEATTEFKLVIPCSLFDKLIAQSGRYSNSYKYLISCINLGLTCMAIIRDPNQKIFIEDENGKLREIIE